MEAKGDRRSYLMEEEGEVALGRRRETYRSGARWSGVVGKIFLLRGNFRLDVRVSGPEIASIRMALIQLYQPEDDPF